ncbi:MAG: hypothetical protein ACK53Y_20480, partial [bacterium]
ARRFPDRESQLDFPDQSTPRPCTLCGTPSTARTPQSSQYTRVVTRHRACVPTGPSRTMAARMDGVTWH